MKFDYKYALTNSSELIPLALFFGTASYISSINILVRYAIILAILYYIYYIKLEVPLRNKHPSLSESNRTTPTVVTYVLMPLTIFGIICITHFNLSGAWFVLVLLILRWLKDGFSKTSVN